MADYSNSPNMNLPVPNVGVAPGPEWAQLLNACLTLIDQHTHVSGSGVPVNPGGMNINSDLTFNSNNLTSARSIRFSAQNTPIAQAADIGCLYESGVDLYYNDGLGNQVRITQSGGVVGSPGSISNLASPASATYVSGNQTFVWQSAANTPANLDCASILIRNLSAGSNALTLNPPNAMGTNYSLTFPTLPGAQSFVTLDASGNFGAPIAFSQGVTRSNLAAVGQQISSSCGNATTVNSNTMIDVTNLAVTITTTGRPVVVACIPDGNLAEINGQFVAQSSGATAALNLRLLRDTSTVANWGLISGGTTAPALEAYGASTVYMVDTPSAGTYVYKLQYSVGTNIQSAQAQHLKLIAYEL